MAKGNLTKKQRKQTVEAMRLAYDGETQKQLAASVAELRDMLEYFYYDLPVDNAKRREIKVVTTRASSVLKRYREGKQ